MLPDGSVAAVVFAVIAALVLVPIAVDRYTRPLHDEMRNVTEPVGTYFVRERTCYVNRMRDALGRVGSRAGGAARLETA